MYCDILLETTRHHTPAWSCFVFNSTHTRRDSSYVARVTFVEVFWLSLTMTSRSFSATLPLLDPEHYRFRFFAIFPSRAKGTDPRRRRVASLHRKKYSSQACGDKTVGKWIFYRSGFNEMLMFMNRVFRPAFVSVPFRWKKPTSTLDMMLRLGNTRAARIGPTLGTVAPRPHLPPRETTHCEPFAE